MSEVSSTEKIDIDHQQKDETKFNPVEDIQEFFQKRYELGDLSIYLLGIVIIINFVAFQSRLGYAIYYWIPVIFLLISFFTKYWEISLGRFHYLGMSSIIFAALWDLVVSISYLYPFTEDYTNPAYITLILDLSIIAYVSYWKFRIYNPEKFVEEKIEDSEILEVEG